MQIKLPYGRSHLTAQLPDERVVGVVHSHLDDYRPDRSQQKLIDDSLMQPHGAPPLWELSRGKNRVVIIASDHTRPVPSKLIIPAMLREIRRGNPQADITILIATGCHRAPTPAELTDKFGPEVYDNERIVIHDCFDESTLADLGTLPSGGRLFVNRLALEADLLVSEGFIEPHFFAGYSGGRKSVLPGIASRQTVYYNHCSAFIADPCARAGILEGNPIHRDMIFAAEVAKLQFIVNVVINSRKEVIASFAGDCREAHEAGCEFLASLCKTPAIPADIVLTTNNGYPLDQNIYQAVKGMCTAEAACRNGGVIIIAAKCEDGIGGDAFYHTFADEPDSQAIYDQILAVAPDDTIADQWQSQIFARILKDHHVILISEADPQIVRQMHMHPASTVEEALSLADHLLGFHSPESDIRDASQQVAELLEAASFGSDMTTSANHMAELAASSGQVADLAEWTLAASQLSEWTIETSFMAERASADLQKAKADADAAKSHPETSPSAQPTAGSILVIPEGISSILV